MNHVQNAVRILQEALVNRETSTVATQTDITMDTLDKVENHVLKAYQYLWLSPPDNNDFDTVADNVSVLSDPLHLDHMSPVVAEKSFKSAEIATPDTELERLVKYSKPKTKRKKRDRDSGANDDESFIMERHNRTYLAYKPSTGSWQLKAVLRDKNEDWSDAENTISEKMRNAIKNGKTVNNVFTEREKLVELWSNQRGIMYTDGIELSKDKTNLQIFVEIKKESPGLIRSGLPSVPGTLS